MISLFRRMRIGRQIQLTTVILILSAFVLTAWFVYQQAAKLLLDNLLAAQQSQVNALAQSVEGRYQSTLDVVKNQLHIWRDYRLQSLQSSGQTEQINGFTVPQLLLDGRPVSESVLLVDQFRQRTGSHATIFVRQGNDFLRVATSLKKRDGNRATGTMLGTNHPGYRDLIAGKAFNNTVTLFGERYLAYYMPLMENGRVYAIAFAGMPLSAVMSDIFASLGQVVWGKTGYSMVVDRSDGELLFHPKNSLVGTSMLTLKASDGSLPFADLLAQQQGVIQYPWLHNGIDAQKAVAYATIEQWNWVLLGGTFVEEITAQSKVLLGDIALIALFAVVLTVGLLTLILNRTLSPLANLTARVGDFGRGNISQKIADVEHNSRNEIHHLAGGLANMGSNLLDMVKQLRNSGGQLENTAQHLEDVAGDSRSQLAELDLQTNQLATAIEEVSASASSVAEQAESIAAQVQGAESETADSADAIGHMVSEMSELGDDLASSSQAIQAVAGFSARIQDVTKLIDDIAEQTNLLALNAAIEAARAGEHGRGFAVVADEVRQLAHRTQNSVQEVIASVEQLQQTSDNAVSTMEASRLKGEKVRATADNTGEAIAQLSQQISRISEMTQSIAATAEQQAHVSHELAAGVTQVRELSAKNLAGSEQTVGHAQSVSAEARSLNQQVAFFS
ncbi:methyl-accepting chemotaxis protein [Neiella sp. HB171785]|uniref:Methyl-accepting chemotaxis protein n=1 Tax=Neiella litorisoli TaxID=2771431 RepID=A0A8J6UKU8_9GAMM|nr:methyl-accepting chemotaxis protein [Neiella litorisoli]MBD1387840.1 methyl-accepting chemotaxis protein [Neiella litorisoli]